MGKKVQLLLNIIIINSRVKCKSSLKSKAMGLERRSYPDGSG